LSFQLQAGVAFTTLLDALIIALAALLPNTNLLMPVCSSPTPGSARPLAFVRGRFPVRGCGHEKYALLRVILLEFAA
jgi:hypothetical protein